VMSYYKQQDIPYYWALAKLRTYPGWVSASVAR